MAKVTVTGAGGFIGAYLTRRLLAQGHHVLAIDNYVRGRPSRLEALTGEIERLDLDVRDADSLISVMGGVETVFHLAAVNGTENFYNHPELVLDVGLRGALAVAEACVKRDVSDLVVASSAEVYQTPEVVPTDETVPLVLPNSLNPRYSYGGSKIVSELIAFNYCRDKLAKVQAFRPHNVYGPDMGWKHVIPQLIEKVQRAADADNDTIELQGDGSETRAFCYVEDIVDGIIKMWRHGETMNVYHIGSMEEVTVAHLAQLISRAVGYEVGITPGAPMPGATPRRCPDIAKMEAIGYTPATFLAKGVENTVAWYLDNFRPVDGSALL